MKTDLRRRHLLLSAGAMLTSMAIFMLAVVAKDPAAAAPPLGANSRSRSELNSASRHPLTPMTKEEILGKIHEGCERIQLQDLETDLHGMIRESETILRLRAAFEEQHKITASRKERMSLEKATDIITRQEEIVADPKKLLVLGKAFFWDMQVGSDGQTACASCHFRAGADYRGTSLGMARRVGSAKPADPVSGLEPSQPLNGIAMLLIYKNRWGKMIDFDGFLKEQSINAIKSVAELSDSELNPIKKQLLEATNNLVSEVKDLRDLKTRLDSMKGTLTDSTLTVENAANIERVRVAEASLVFIGEAKWKQTDTPRLKTYSESMVKNLVPEFDLAPPGKDDQQKNDQQKLAAEIVGQALAPPRNQQGNKRESLGRNAPTVINSGLHDRLFHDGRAASTFNGYDHLGDDAGRDGVGKWQFVDNQFRRVLIRIPHAALASQSTAPLLSSSEMSWFGRQYHHVARKLLDSRPLRLQDVKADDSVLGAYVEAGQQGIKTTYRRLIQEAFRPEWWNGPETEELAESDAFTGQRLKLKQIEANFSLFWGLALMEYQKSLLSDQTTFDELMQLRRSGTSLIAGKTPEQIAAQEKILKGFELFEDHGCADCHLGPEFAGATFSTVYGPNLEFEPPLDALNPDNEENEFVARLEAAARGDLFDGRVESMPFRRDLAPRYYDRGFYNLGVTTDNPNYGLDDPYATPEEQKAYEKIRQKYSAGIADEVVLDLSSSDGALLSIANRFGQGNPVDLWQQQPPVTFSLARRFDDERDVTPGSFKAPTLRNSELTGPYFHDGSAGAISVVLKFYQGFAKSGIGLEFPNQYLHPALVPDPLTGRTETAVEDADFAAVEAFLNSLTDERVRSEKPPFDRPSLSVPVDVMTDENGQSATLKSIEELP